MKCNNCGNEIKPGDKFCTACGSAITSNQEVNNSVINTEPETKTIEQTPDEELIKAYIGKNYEKISQKSFSLPAFFLTSIYLLYRKLYIYTLILIIGSIVLSFIPLISLISSLLISIVLGLKFNEIYLEEVKRKVEIIKLENKTATKEELLDICSKKGGTNIVAPIIAIATVFILIVLLILFFVAIIRTSIDKTDEMRDIFKEYIESGEVYDQFDENNGNTEDEEEETPSNNEDNYSSNVTDQKLISISYLALNNKINAKESFILVLSQTTCPHCADYKPKFDKVLSKYNIEAYSLEIDLLKPEERNELSNKIAFQGTPTTLFFENGEEKDQTKRIIGNASEDMIIERLKELGYINQEEIPTNNTSA